MPQTKKPAKPAKAAQKPKPAVQPISAPIETAPEVPDWVNETPDDNSYDLVMYEGGGGSEQTVPLYREEYIWLKRVLAASRGHALRAPMDRWGVRQLSHKSEDERKAATLEITQEEIQMVIDCDQICEFMCLNLRQRLSLGATVEEGKWHLKDQGGDMDKDGISGINRHGLDINVETDEAS